MSAEKTLQMRLNHALYRFRQLALEQRENVVRAGPYTKKRLEYCAVEIENTLRRLEKELAEIKWIEID
jgi:hypothetical protein